MITLPPQQGASFADAPAAMITLPPRQGAFADVHAAAVAPKSGHRAPAGAAEAAATLRSRSSGNSRARRSRATRTSATAANATTTVAAAEASRPRPGQRQGPPRPPLRREGRSGAVASERAFLLFYLQQQEIEKGDRKSRFFFFETAYRRIVSSQTGEGGWLRVFEKKSRRQAPFFFSTRRI